MLILQDKVFNYIITSYQSYDINTIKDYQELPSPPKLQSLQINVSDY